MCALERLDIPNAPQETFLAILLSLAIPDHTRDQEAGARACNEQMGKIIAVVRGDECSIGTSSALLLRYKLSTMHEEVKFDQPHCENTDTRCKAKAAMLAKYQVCWSKLANLQHGDNTTLQAGQLEAPTYDIEAPRCQEVRLTHQPSIIRSTTSVQQPVVDGQVPVLCTCVLLHLIVSQTVDLV